MDERLFSLLEMSDREFAGDSMNGPSLMQTLSGLSTAEAASTDTFEGYSAWEIAVHCAWYKYQVTQSLGNADDLEPYPWAKGNFVPLPNPANDNNWKMTLDYLVRVHRACMKNIRALDRVKVDSNFILWKDMSYLEAISWLCTHDIFHNVQIRNMGITSLRQVHE